MNDLRLTEIRVFPVKSLGGSLVRRAHVEPRGLADDRRWLVVDDDLRAITQRDQGRMALVQASAAEGGLVLSTPSMAQLYVAFPGVDTPAVAATIWRDTVPALPAGREADAWLTAALGLSCRLLFQHDPVSRPLKSDYAAPGEVVSFADGYPLLLTNMASLDDVNRRLEAPVEMLRFRPNLVVTGAPAWAEDSWRRLRIGGAAFRVAKPCDRCIMTTIDPATGERPDRTEPLRTLASFRRDPRGIMFGQNLVPERCGEVRIGDAVEILESGAPNVNFA